MLLANAAQIRRADQIMIEQYQFPGILLMETAGRLATERILSLYPEQQSFLLLIGPGNNGGDGLAIARRLHVAGKQVKMIFSHPAERFQGDAQINYEITSRLPISTLLWSSDGAGEWESGFAERPVLIDALLGTGISDRLRGAIAEMIEYFSPLDLPTIAIDLPSGMDANTGFLLNQVLVAEHCLTFQLAKLCHYVTPATNACGQVHVLDIEIWPEVIKQLEIKRYLTDADFVESIQSLREADSHKGSYGHVLLIGGSRDMTGAICLSAEAALRSGAGLVTVVCPSACREVLLTRLPEAMCIGLGSAERQMLSIDDLPEIRARMAGKSALAIGPGMGTAPESLTLIEALLDEISLPVVWDADALNLLAKIENWQKRLPKASVLTPHPGEMKRLCQSATVNHHRLESAEALAANCRATILLKGRYSIIASPEGKTYVNPTGNAGMATAGSGDVLTGLIAGKLAQGYSPDHAAILGAYLHGAAGDRAAGRLSQATMLASDILQHLS